MIKIGRMQHSPKAIHNFGITLSKSKYMIQPTLNPIKNTLLAGLAVCSFNNDLQASTFSYGGGGGIGAGQINGSNHALNSEAAKGGSQESSRYPKRLSNHELEEIGNSLNPGDQLLNWNGYPLVIEKDQKLERISNAEFRFLKNKFVMTMGAVGLLAGVGLIVVGTRTKDEALGGLALAPGLMITLMSPATFVTGGESSAKFPKVPMGAVDVVLLSDDKTTPMTNKANAELILAWKEDRYVAVNWMKRQPE